ncbi:MAG: Heterodisulfide reductase subunit B-like protein @ Putative succinate dehydrogenase subunit, partial [uncultured Solirubrobacterales bacterium]
EGRLLAGLRLARLHTGAARLHGRRRSQARPRAGRARPRQLLRSRGDRRAQPGARRHPQREDLRPRPGHRRLDDEHLLDLPGRAVGVPAASRRRPGLPGDDQLPSRARGSALRARPRRLEEQEPAVDAGRGHRPGPPAREGRAPARGAAGGAVLRLLHRAAHRPARLRRVPAAGLLPRLRDRGPRGHRGRVRRQPQVLRVPGHHDGQDDLAAPGRPPPRRRHRRRRGLPGHAVPALPLEPRSPAARCREVRRARARHSGAPPSADGRPRARARAQGARDGQARGQDPGRAAQGRGAGRRV